MAGEAVNTPGTENTTTPNGGDTGGGDGGACGEGATLIHEVQGAGPASPLVGSTVTVEGVVVGDFQNDDEPDDGDLDGFHVQEKDADADADPATSEGVFIFRAAEDVAVGDVVRVAGAVAEFVTSGGASSQTQLTNTTVQICTSGAPLPTPASAEFPVDQRSDLEVYEGMRAIVPQDLVISEYFNYDRFGEIVLALPFGDQDRLHQPTAVVEPGTGANALQDGSRCAGSRSTTVEHPEP